MAAKKKYRFNKYQKEWLKKLRSGRLRQGQYNLRNNGAYCCLGVGALACGVRHDNAELNTLQVLDSGLEDVRKKLRLRDEDGIYDGGSLTGQNDQQGRTFEQIADFIEANPELVFTDGRT